MHGADLCIMLSFVLFVGATFNYIRNLVFTALNRYSDGVKDTVAEAEKIRQDAEKELADLRDKYQSVRIEIDNIISLAKAEGVSIIEDAKTKTSDMLAQKAEVSATRISRYEEDFYREIKRELVAKVMLAVEESLSKKLDSVAKHNAVGRSIEQFKNLL